MYLNTVLDALSKKTSVKLYNAEDLYKLNEAIFNLPEVEVVNSKTTAKIFAVLEKFHSAYDPSSKSHKSDGGAQSDPNFFYDYVALMGTMQNQHFFNEKQNKSILMWIREATEHELGKTKDNNNNSKAANASAKEVSRLEAENSALKQEIEKLRELSEAVQAIKAYKPVEPEPKAKAKAKTKSRAKRTKGPKKDADASPGQGRRDKAEGKNNEEE